MDWSKINMDEGLIHIKIKKVFHFVKIQPPQDLFDYNVAMAVWHEMKGIRMPLNIEHSFYLHKTAVSQAIMFGSLEDSFIAICEALDFYYATKRQDDRIISFAYALGHNKGL